MDLSSISDFDPVSLFYVVFFFTLQVALDIYIEQIQQEIEEDTQLNILIINTSYSDFIGVVYR